MLELGINGYTRQEVIDQLHGKNGSRGLVKIRYDLLNRQDVKLGELMVQSGRVAMDSLAEIKRTASFELTEQEAQDVDWLSDRIRPVFCLKMPEIRKTYKAWGKIDASFTRSSIAYLSDGTQVAANVPRFEQGKFGQAVMVEEGTTNLVDINNFAFVNGASLVDIVHPVTGKTVKAIKLPQGANTPVSFSQYLNLSTNTNYTVSFDLWASDNSNTAINIDLHPDTLPETSKTPTTNVQRHTWTLSSSNSDMGNCRLRFFDNSSQPMPNDVYIAMIQLEQKPYATSFIDGTRAREILKLFDDAQTRQYFPATSSWRISLWVKLNNATAATRSRKVFSCTEAGGFALGIETGWGRYRVLFNDNGTYKNLNFLTEFPFDDLLWHYVVLVYDYENHKARLYLDGVKQSETDITQLHYGTNNAFVLGTESAGGGGSTTEILNGLIDDVIISNRAPTDAEILAEYQRNKPHLIDQWTTAKFSFDDKLSGDYFTLVDRDISAQWIEWPLGVFLLSSPTRRNENRKIKREIEAYDASLILKEDKFTDRYIVAAGTKYTDAIIDILNSAGIWKINIIDHPGTLATDREFEIGIEKLFAINELLAAINYTSLWVDENGYFVAQPYVLPSSRDPEYEYRTNDLSIIHPDSGVEELDLFGVPNTWVRYVSNPDRAVILRSEYINDLSTSPTSTINRGRTIVDIDSVEDIYDQVTLDDYVKRIAYNANQIYGKFEFATALMPHHSYYNCLFVEYDPLGISHKYMESSWTMDLHANGVMRHSCRRVIQI